MSGEDDERCLVSEVSNWAIWFDTVMGKDEVAPLSTSDSSAVAPLSREHRRRTEVKFGVGCKADKHLCMNCSSSSIRRRVPVFFGLRASVLVSDLGCIAPRGDANGKLRGSDI